MKVHPSSVLFVTLEQRTNQQEERTLTVAFVVAQSIFQTTLWVVLIDETFLMNGADLCPGLCFNNNYYSHKLKNIWISGAGYQSKPFEASDIQAKSSLINATIFLMFT